MKENLKENIAFLHCQIFFQTSWKTPGKKSTTDKKLLIVRKMQTLFSIQLNFFHIVSPTQLQSFEKMVQKASNIKYFTWIFAH